MPLVSSPMAYPPSSSPPPAMSESRKRTQPDEPGFPAKRKLLNFKSTKILGDLSCHVLNSRDGVDESLITTAKAQIAQNQTGPFIEDDDNYDPADDLATYAMIQNMFKTPPAPPNLHSAITREPQAKQPDISCKREMQVRTSAGKSFKIKEKTSKPSLLYEQLVATRSNPLAGKATKSYYGINIHDLIEKAGKEANPGPIQPPVEAPRPSIESSKCRSGNKLGRTLMWTEKYRAKKFTDLVGDERTHRNVLRWLKGWDSIVFPGIRKAKPLKNLPENTEEAIIHRKILLLTGPPGLGKTTLAHVCARQAGYEVVEINASDDRNRDVVKGRIKDSVGTENVRGVNVSNAGGALRKAGKPVCVVVDEVDGVVGGGAGGEGGFIKALIDLVVLDQKNSTSLGTNLGNAGEMKRSKRGDRFQLLRPIILICNDVYHPSLRPLRSSSIAETIHIRRPPLDKVVARLRIVFDREGIACDGDGVRRLCEATWGIKNRRESQQFSSNTGEGDLRAILVVGEWAASKLRAQPVASAPKGVRLTKKWVEEHMLQSLSQGGGAERGVGRGGTRDVAQRVFLEGAGFPKLEKPALSDEPAEQQCKFSVGVSELVKRNAIERLRNMIDSCGDTDRIVEDCFAAYPLASFQDDTVLSKPNMANEWIHLHDRLSTKVYSGQEWELSPYLSQAILGFHCLFAAPPKSSWSGDDKRWKDDTEEEPLPFSSPRAYFEASEAYKQNKAILSGLQASFSIPLLRAFRSSEEISSELLPNLIKILTPDVKPVVVGGSGDQKGVVSVRKESERAMVRRAVGVMSAVGVKFERMKIEGSQIRLSNFIYRMEPPLDVLADFETASQGGVPVATATRYAIRQVLDQEYQKYILLQNAATRQARYRAGNLPGREPILLAPDVNSTVLAVVDGEISKLAAARRDFFGRIINDAAASTKDGVPSECMMGQVKSVLGTKKDREIWVSFHEGFSNAVRKPITLDELMKGF